VGICFFSWEEFFLAPKLKEGIAIVEGGEGGEMDQDATLTIYFDAQFMHSFRPDRAQTVDKPSNDLSRAWNDLSTVWNGI